MIERSGFKYSWYEIVDASGEFVKRFKYWAYAYRFANKLVSEKNANVSIIGVAFDADYNMIRNELVCC